jgi:cytochrome c oxidase subunit 1
MHITGLAGEPRQYAQLTGVPGPASQLLQNTLPLQNHITYSALFLACAQLPFLINLVLTLRSRLSASQNPWSATTMEWAPQDADEHITYREPCHYAEDGVLFFGQWEPDATSVLPPE